MASHTFGIRFQRIFFEERNLYVSGHIVTSYGTASYILEYASCTRTSHKLVIALISTVVIYAKLFLMVASFDDCNTESRIGRWTTAITFCERRLRKTFGQFTVEKH